MKKIIGVIMISSIAFTVVNAKSHSDFQDKYYHAKPIKNDVGFFRHKIKENDIKIQRLWEQIQALENRNYKYLKKIERLRERKSHHMSSLYKGR